MSLQNYLSNAQSGGSVFGSASAEEVNDLIKAMSAGTANPPAGGAAGAGDPLRVESLEKTLTRLTFAEEHCPLWKDIKKEPAYSTVEEFNVLSNYGGERLSAFTSEGELPTADDATYQRNTVTVKFMGTLRAVSHPLGMVRTAHGDVIARETINGTLWLMRQIERSLYYGSTTSNPAEYDGFWQQMVAGDTLVIDKGAAACVGGQLTMDDIEDASEAIFGTGGFGKMDTIYWPSGTHKNVAQNLFGTASANVRLNADNVMGGPAVPGFSLSRIATVFGDINVKPDVFLQPRLVSGIAASGTASLIPSTAVIDAQPAMVGGTVPVHAWDTATGNYRYLIVAVNSAGNAAALETAAVNVNAEDHVKWVIKDPAGVEPTGYEVWRETGPASGDFALIDKIGQVDAGASATTIGGNEVTVAADKLTYIDKNAMIAGAGMAFGFTSGQNTMSFKQLAPFMKIPLAQIDLRTRWAQILYGAPVLRAPKKCVLFKNVLTA